MASVFAVTAVGHVIVGGWLSVTVTVCVPEAPTAVLMVAVPPSVVVTVMDAVGALVQVTVTATLYVLFAGLQAEATAAVT